MTDARREPLTRYWVDKHRLVDEQASVDISSVPNSLCVVLASDYDALDDRLAASETVPEEVQQQVREETKCTEDVSTWSKAVAILIDDSQHWSKHSLTQLCEENHTLKQRLAEYEALIGTIRETLCIEPVRDVADITPEQHSQEIIGQLEQRLAKSEKAAYDVDGVIDHLKKQLAEAQKTIASLQREK